MCLKMIDTINFHSFSISIQPSAWDKDPVPENLPPPSERHKQQYAQYKEEMQQSYRQKNLEMDEVLLYNYFLLQSCSIVSL